LTKHPAALDANALELFARVVAAGSFAQAARELHLTRAAVSRRIASMEEQLGKPLVVRTTRSFGLTEAGRRLALRARAVMDAADAARRGWRLGARSGLAGTLRVTSVPSFGATVLAPLLARFQALHPALKLELRLTHRRVDLMREDTDVAFRMTTKPPQDLVAQPVLRAPVHAYAAPALKLRLGSPQALATERCLVFGNPSETVSLAWRHDDGHLAGPVLLEPALWADDLGTLMAVARAGGGVVFAPAFCAQNDLRDRVLVNVLPGWRCDIPDAEVVQALTLPVPEAPDSARALVKFVRDALAATTPEVSKPPRARAAVAKGRAQERP